MNYVLNGTASKNFPDLIERQFETTLPEITPEILENAKDHLEALCSYSAALNSTCKKLRQEIFDNRITQAYYDIDLPVITTLSAMENTGVTVDKTVLAELEQGFQQRLDKLSEEIHKLAGEEFNIGSPKQLGEVLFDHLGIQGGKKSKSGAYSTDSDVLETLAIQGHDIADKVLQWRGLSKLISTYTKALTKEINPKTGRVHTTYKNTATLTGRLSSVNPNLQNIPIRTEDGRKIRYAFVAEKGKKFVGADYSQIELRLLAHVADMPVLKEAFKNDQDIHKTTASEVFGVPIDQVTPDQRSKAKTINFGIIYGQSAFGLAKQLRIPRGEAKAYIDQYFKEYPGIRKYMDDMIEFGRTHGFVKTIFGRKIILDGINDKNPIRRSGAERVAINAPLQGSAADIIKKAMIQVHEYFEKENLDAKLLLQIHDELIIECAEDIAEDVSKNVKKIMENVAFLSVPLTVDAAIGNNWGEVH
jgi:DNA polymerase-1